MRFFRIGILRRTVQIIALVLLIYGGYIFKHPAEEATKEKDRGFLPELRAPEDKISTTKFQRGNILWPSGATPVIEIFPPGLVCRFNPEGGLFKACIVHFISENLTWQTSVRYLLPYLSLFVLLCFLFGRMWCGWVCPIGTIGDFLTWLRRKMNIPPRRFPAVFRKGLRWSSYGILGASFSISALIGFPNLARFQCFWFLPYCQVCPARLICPLFGLIKPSWKDFSTGVTTMFTILAWATLLVFIAAFYWGRRVWCHLCPAGLINSWFNKGSALELHKKAAKCNKCASCADSCPMNLSKMYSAEKDLIYNEKGCIMCFRCVEACPQKDCLSINYLGAKIIGSRFK